MIAQATGFKAGELVHVIADAHIYDRHIPLVEEIIEKTPMDGPDFYMNPDVKDFYQFTVDSFRVENYHFHKLGKTIEVAI
jgi:thymidylate synthase